MSDPRTSLFASSLFAAALAVMRRIADFADDPHPPPSPVSQEGYKAHKDGLPLSACPYVRKAQADEWRSGWEDAEQAMLAW